MKKLLFTLLAVAVIAGIFVATCPDEKEHAKAILSIFEDTARPQDAAAIRLITKAVEDAITIDDYYIFNIGKVKSANSDKSVTFGILGKAYLLDKEAHTGKKVNK